MVSILCGVWLLRFGFLGFLRVESWVLVLRFDWREGSLAFCFSWWDGDRRLAEVGSGE